MDSPYRRSHELRAPRILCYTAARRTDQAPATLWSSVVNGRSRLTRSERRATETLEITGHLSPADKENSAYVLLPFDVPDRIARLEIRYSFSEDKPGGFLQQPGNLLDIDLFANDCE